jgi:hypothetical protein
VRVCVCQSPDARFLSHGQGLLRAKESLEKKAEERKQRGQESVEVHLCRCDVVLCW